MFRSRCWWHHRIRFDELWEAWNPAAGVQVGRYFTRFTRFTRFTSPASPAVPAVPAVPRCMVLLWCLVGGRPSIPTVLRAPPAHARHTQHLDPAGPLSDEIARTPPRALAPCCLGCACVWIWRRCAPSRAEPS
jgi:hypothetical protein